MFTINSRKALILLVLAALCVTTLLWITLKNTPLLQQPTLSSRADSSSTQTLQQEVRLVPPVGLTEPMLPADISKRVTTVSSPWPTIMGSPADEAEVKGWFDARGYPFWGEGNNEYGSYDKEALEKLAQNGDVRAMKMLGKLLYRTEGFEKAKEAYINAAVHGSSDAIDSVGTAIDVSVFSNAKTDEDKHASALEVLAWYDTAALRGDNWPNIVSASSFRRINNIQLSDIDNQNIQKRSQEIYDDLLKRRKMLGLGDFDNSVPESVKRYFQTLESK